MSKHIDGEEVRLGLIDLISFSGEVNGAKYFPTFIISLCRVF